MSKGILKPLTQRIRDLEKINTDHKKLNGELRLEIQQKEKKISELNERINNPLKKMRDQGEI